MSWHLVVQEIKSLPRGRWTLLTGTLWMLVLTLFAVGVLASEGPSLFSSLVLFYVLPPLALLPMTAGYVASDRSTRFAQAVLTSPVGRAPYFLAKLAAPAAVGLLYLGATLPFVAVFAIHVGVPALMWSFLLLSCCLVACSVILGGLFGVLFVGRSAAAAVGAASGFMVFSGIATFGLPLALQMAPGLPRSVMLTLVHLSPVTLGFDLFGLHGFALAEKPWTAGAAMGLLATGGFAAALWIFARLQSAETWEIKGKTRGLLAVLLGGLVVLPAAIANADYTEAPPTHSMWSSGQREGAPQITYVEAGKPIKSLSAGRLVHDNGRLLHLDGLVVFQTDIAFPIRDLELSSEGPNGTLHGRVAQVEGWEPQEPGVSPRIVRIPLTATFHSPGVLGSHAVEFGYVLAWTDAEGQTRQETGRSMVTVREASAPLHLGLAGLPAISLCLAGYASRHWRTR